MDLITKTLREYLTSVNISNTTLYNTDCSNKKGLPTSTSFILKSKNNPKRFISVIIDIYPEDYQFFLSAHPNIVFDDENMDHVHALEAKWNRSGFMTTLIIEEENGVINPNTYCFKLMSCGFCGNNGLEESVWKRYIEKIEQEYLYIEEYIKERSDD